MFKGKVVDNGKNYSGLLTETIGPILNQEKMLRWLNSQTQNDHISSFPMLLQWFVHSEPNNVNGMKDKWLRITEWLYESSLGRNYRLRINALLMPEWWELCICLVFFFFFILLGKHDSFQGFGVTSSKRFQLRNGTVVCTHNSKVFLLWIDIMEGLYSVDSWWYFQTSVFSNRNGFLCNPIKNAKR